MKFKRNRSASKQMIACFFAKFGHVVPYRLRTKRRLRLTGTSTTVCLKSSRHGVNGIPERMSGVYCSTMTMPAAVTLDCLAAKDVQLVTHPPCSPDLAPCDWFLFPFVKWQLKGKQFQNAEDARAFIEGVILDIHQSTWSGVLDSWFEKMVKCVQTEGGVFEKLE